MTTNHYKAMCEALGKSERALNAESMANQLAIAQVHATAFAGEQARIGNLIEVATYDDLILQKEVRGEPNVTIAEGDPNAAAILHRHARIGETFREIREGLGL